MTFVWCSPVWRDILSAAAGPVPAAARDPKNEEDDDGREGDLFRSMEVVYKRK